MAKKIGSETITVIRKTKVDRLSTSAAPAAPEHDVEGCVVLPRASSGAQASSETDKGWVIVEGKMIIAPYDADVLPDDQVRYGGTVYDVDGQIGRYKKKRGQEKACIFYLKTLGT